MTSFRPYDPDQQLLLPPSLRDWLPPDHLVWFISETVDQLDLGEIIEGYRDGGQGNLPYHPAMMLKILIYAYATGVFSSRRIARQIEENIAFRVLAAGNTPDHRTICRFREPKDQENFTDPESRIMKEGSGAFQQCYNAQAAVDGQQRIIVAVSVQQSASDARALIPMVEQAKQNVGQRVKEVLADAGYASEANLRALERRRIKGYIALGREGKTARTPKRKAPATKRMLKTLRSKRGRAKYKRRKHTAEPPFGWMKRGLGFRQFSVRGLAKVSGEFNLVCLALNLRRMSSMIRWA